MADLKPKNLTQGQVATVRQWLGNHWKSGCPFDGTNNWTVGELPVRLRGMKDEDFDASGSYYPVIMVQCNTCGYEVLLNSIKLGIVKPGSS